MLLVNLFVDSIAPSGHVRVELCVPLPSQLRVRVLLNSASTTDWNQPTCVRRCPVPWLDRWTASIC
jgi:hypothetical protein|eukprot:COSAG01_NODE_293_length_19376_cov_41.772060_8_plen_66_part_00